MCVQQWQTYRKSYLLLAFFRSAVKPSHIHTHMLLDSNARTEQFLLLLSCPHTLSVVGISVLVLCIWKKVWLKIRAECSIVHHTILPVYSLSLRAKIRWFSVTLLGSISLIVELSWVCSTEADSFVRVFFFLWCVRAKGKMWGGRWEERDPFKLMATMQTESY